jgi:hypothetical protein
MFSPKCVKALPFPYPALLVALPGLPTIDETAIEERQD